MTFTKKQLENKAKWEGQIIKSARNGYYKVINYINNYTVFVQFLETGFIKSTNLWNIERGTVSDPYYVSVYNFGYIGEGKFNSSKHSSNFKIYKRWIDMIRRCYDPSANHYNRYGERGVIVCEEWRNFQNYGEWELNNCPNPEFRLDKDILFKYNKIYSPKTCCFVPEAINSIFCNICDKTRNLPTGVSIKGNSYIAQCMINNKKVHLGSYKTPEEAFYAYKEGKEYEIKRIAELYKPQILPNVYEALLNYQVEIND